MTSEEIKNEHPGRLESWEPLVYQWLKEIAYQLAIMNERQPEGERIQRLELGLEKLALSVYHGLNRAQPGKRDADSERGGVWIGDRVKIVKPPGYQGPYQGTGVVLEVASKFAVRPDEATNKIWWFEEHELAVIPPGSPISEPAPSTSTQPKDNV